MWGLMLEEVERWFLHRFVEVEMLLESSQHR
jgi:hypothetical protein